MQQARQHCLQVGPPIESPGKLDEVAVTGLLELKGVKGTSLRGL